MDAKPPTDSPAKPDRRALLLGAIFLVGGGAALVHFSRERKTPTAGGSPLSHPQFTLLEQVTETIIPTTDTPGAIGAGVPAFLRSLLADWASEDTRREMIGVLDIVEHRAWSKFGAAFAELAADSRSAVLGEIDAQATPGSGWRRFKHLVLLGYYQSEVGATQELRFELVPGAWRSCVPLDEVGRASAV